MNKEILRLAIPNILSNISIPLLSTVDTALMGRLSEVHLGAVGLGAMIFNFVYWNFGFLRMGTTGITAQAFGQQNASEVVLTLGRALLVGAILAAIVLLLQRPIEQVSFSLLSVSSESYPLIQAYFRIRVLAAPATLGLFAMMGWFFGMQNAIYPLILTLIINATNIAVNFLLVYRYGMGVEGVAWGTVVAQYVGLLMALLFFAYRYKNYLADFQRDLLIEWQALRKFLIINRDIFIRTVCLTFAFGFFYSQSSQAGETILAINVILLQFVNWMSYAIDGFAFASESLVGKYWGAREEEQLRRSIRLTFGWGMGMAVLFSLVYTFGGNALLQVFTDQPDLIAASQPYLIWMILFPLLATPCYLWDGIFIGLTASVAMRNSMLLSLALFFAAYYLFASLGWGNHGLWLVLILFMVARGAIQAWMYTTRKASGAFH